AAKGGHVRIYFFFSSRRRHTRLVSDWSSDVCSSDLDWPIEDFNLVGGKLVVSRLEKAVSRIAVHDLAGKKLAEVKLPGPGASGRSEERRVGKKGKKRGAAE